MKQLQRTEHEIREALADRRNGRDEMNLIELPVFLLSTRATEGNNVLEFAIEDFDRESKQVVKRKLTVTGDPKFGLPTAPAEEVYLGLLHHTKAYNEFSHPRVFLSRGGLLRSIGWKNKDSSYHRLTRCMDQLSGVRLKCENYWRDNSSKEYRTIENISIIDYYRFRDSRSRGNGRFEEYLSEFQWGSALFDSFDAGYLKKLDLQVALEMKPLPRRLYRMLDKHFYPPYKTKLVYDLHQLAHERLGMSRGYDAAQIRRALEPAIDELVKRDCIEPAPKETRFVPKNGCRGRWNIVFQMKEQAKNSKAWHDRGHRKNNSLNAHRPNRPDLRIFRGGQFVD